MDIALQQQATNNLVYTVTVAAFTLAIVFETFAPRRELAAGVAARWANNFGLGLLTWFTTLLAGSAYLLWLASWTTINDIGLLRTLEVGPVAGFFIMLLVTQLLDYWIHRGFHHFAWLWPLHAVHHSDTEMDVSTSYRHHPLEPLVSLPVTSVVVLLLGVPPGVALAYRLFSVCATVFSHSNIRIAERVERYLHYLILTPDFHRLHHCSQPRYTDSNYGSLLPWFDYLFGTVSARPYAQQSSMELGLQYLRAPSDSRLDRQLAMPLAVRRAVAAQVSPGGRQ